MPRKIWIFDTTLRDGEQAPGASLNLGEKLQIAHQLARLQVDVIEAGFPISSPEDFEAVKAIGSEVRGPVICGLARALEPDVVRCWEAVKFAEKSRIHTFIATSDIHVDRKLRKTREQVLQMAVAAVKLARSLCEDVEFSPEDAARTGPEYMAEVVQAAIEAGAGTINIPDTVGYSVPWEFGARIQYLFEHVPNIAQARISAHCHDDLGMAVSNSLSAVKAGAMQVECCINGVGERAGNASLEEVVMALKTRRDFFDCEVGIETAELLRTSRMVSSLMGFAVPPNKAVVGANAFAHQAGIHQDGMIKDRETYEIMTPESVGWAGTRLVLGRRSGRHALRARLIELGYELTDEQLNKAYERFLAIADRKKEVFDEDLEAIVHDEVAQVPEFYRLEGIETTVGGGRIPTALVRLKTEEGVKAQAATGDGPVDAIYNAIDLITGLHLKLTEYNVRGVSAGKDAVGEATVRVLSNGEVVVGVGSSTDVIEASALAYVNAVNKLLQRRAAGEVAAPIEDRV